MTTPLLSILIPATPARLQSHLWPLWQKLAGQVDGKTVELLVFLDNRQRSIGEKRDALVQMSRGKYVAFVDDDDDVSDNYVSALIAGTASAPDVVTFKQRAVVDGVEGICDFSIRHSNEPFSPAGFRRSAWHVCAWRGDLARAYRFPVSNYGEDWAWARHLVLEAKTEYHIDQVLHTYRFDSKVSEAPAPNGATPTTTATQRAPELPAVQCYDDIPGWFDFAHLYDEVVNRAPRTATFVELGTFLGKSAAYMMLKIRESGKDINFTSFDNFSMETNADDERGMVEKYGGLEPAARACFTACTGLDSKRFLYNRDSSEAADAYDIHSVDFCFIDADHAEPSVRRDISAWLPKMRIGGILAGHDIDFPDVRRAVEALLPANTVRVIGRCWLHVVAAA